MLHLKPVLCQRELSYECGCRGVHQVIGLFSRLSSLEIEKGVKEKSPDWEVFCCNEHKAQIAEVYKRLETDWRILNGEKL